MNYTVDWSVRAQIELTDVWLRAADRDAVTAAADQVDVLLAREPMGQGESRAGNFRLMFEGPLSVLYRVSRAQRRVVVVSVAFAGPRP
jgi:hypothetical protein